MEPAAAAPGSESPDRPRSVLLIEDNDDARVTLKQLLSLFGHAVHEARDGRSGIEAARSVRPDVVLIDIGLPDMTATRWRERCARTRRGGFSSSR